jgi:hypothetical protein
MSNSTPRITSCHGCGARLGLLGLVCCDLCGKPMCAKCAISHAEKHWQLRRLEEIETMRDIHNGDPGDEQYASNDK